ncbi:hypothetical protein SAMN05421823_11935 [Catalinimonas alkaloidigena]|uniref:Uncharacterized protein n=1 Tax=Catalinimonas alkaloidigena TaxID=1075417 RepID=A0A1G9V757_9BACT|nr:hypothetical protein [Catalinimonas alkaloidigena]SDM67896.1 hypothetical protein SAMN05421823_11935 [Catalinimonas alkaloidigena]
MNYQVKELLNEQFNFAAVVIPEDRQREVEATFGLRLNLAEGVKLLQQETDNFQRQDPIHHEIDEMIMQVVGKWGPLPDPANTDEPTGDVSRETVQEAITALSAAVEFVDTDERPQFEEAVAALSAMLEFI